MARRKTLIDLLDELTPATRQAFLDSIGRVTGDVQIRALEDAISRGDTAAVLQIINLGAEYFAPLDRAMRDAYETGGEFVMAELQRMARAQGFKVSAVFGANDPRVTQWLAEQSSRRIVEITSDQRQIISDTLARLAGEGTAPRTAALELIGRVNRATGRREGGIVGLNSQMEGWAANAYRELIEGDTGYFQRTLRDRRFDRTVAKAIREGRGLGPTEARRIVARYRARLLYRRGENIARTELLGTLHASQAEALVQMRTREGLAPEAVTQEWDAQNDGATRDSHRAMDGQTRTQGQPFTTGNGYQMRHPGDASLGAPASEIVNCRCFLRTRVDFITGLRDRLTPDELRDALEAME